MDIEAAEAFARPRRRRRRGLDATTTLRDFALVTFDVDPGRLAAALPRGLEPEIRTLDDGRARGSSRPCRSATWTSDSSWRPGCVSFFQTNYRAYVRGSDGRRAVFFFGTTLDSPLVALPRRLWGMPWWPGSTTIEATWNTAGVCERYRHRCTGRWGAADVELSGTSAPLGRLDGFVDTDDAAHVLTHPLDGFFLHPQRRLGRYAVWHDRLQPMLGMAHRARYAVFEELGLVAPGAPPHSVLLQRATEFDVLLPPRHG